MKLKSVLSIAILCLCLVKLTDWEHGGLIMLDLGKADVIQTKTEKMYFQKGYNSKKFRTRIVIDKEAYFVTETPEEIERLLKRKD